MDNAQLVIFAILHVKPVIIKLIHLTVDIYIAQVVAHQVEHHLL